MKKQYVIWGVVLILCFFTGCKSETLQTNDGAINRYEVIDDFGNRIVLNGKPQRIYAQTMSLEEILIDLVAPERMVAISEESVDESTSLIAEKAKLVSTKIPHNPSLEQILQLKPDLIIAQENSSMESMQALRDMGVPVYLCNTPTRVAATENRILKLAEIVGEKQRGEAIVREMKIRQENITAVLDRIPSAEKKVVLAYSVLGAFGSEAGLFHDICVHAGVTNGAVLAGLVRGEHLAKEQIVNVNPDIFIFPVPNKSMDSQTIDYFESVKHDPALQGVKAIKENHILFIHDRYRYCNSQYIVDAIEEIAKGSYPQYFK